MTSLGILLLFFGFGIFVNTLKFNFHNFGTLPGTKAIQQAAQKFINIVAEDKKINKHTGSSQLK